jgi:hypothetical protein
LLQAPVDTTYDGGSDAEGGANKSVGGASRSKLDMMDHDLQRLENEVRDHLIKQNSNKEPRE